MPSYNTSRDNLTRWREEERNRGNKNIRSPQETELLKRAIWQWHLKPENERKPKTRKELAKQLGVSRQYVDKVIRRMNFDAPLDVLQQSPVTPESVIEWRKREAEYRALRSPLSVMPSPDEIPASTRNNGDGIPTRQPNSSKDHNFRFSNGQSIFSDPYLLRRPGYENSKPRRFSNFTRWR